MTGSHSGFFRFMGQKIQLFYCKVYSKKEGPLSHPFWQLVVCHQKDVRVLQSPSAQLHRQQRIFAKTQPLLSVRSSPAKASFCFRFLRKRCHGLQSAQKHYFLRQDESCQGVFVVGSYLPRKWKCSVFRLGALFCEATRSFFSLEASAVKRW